MENNKEPYAKNLYQPKNIIGYTGNINKNPTVYFKNGNQYGHITQDHSIKTNIGREIGVSSSLYTAKNNKTTKKLEEAIDGRVFHKSRNPLIKTSNKNELKELSKAIDRYPSLKPMAHEIVLDAKSKVNIDPSLIKGRLNKATVQFEIDLKQESLQKHKPLISEFGKERMQQFKKSKEAKLETNVNKPKTMTDLLSAMAGPAINSAKAIAKSVSPKKPKKEIKNLKKPTRKMR